MRNNNVNYHLGIFQQWNEQKQNPYDNNINADIIVMFEVFFL